MEGIKDYTFQNIIFVHDFAFIFLILVFVLIILYFAVIVYEYTLPLHSIYYCLFKKDYIIPMDKWMKYLTEEILLLRNTKDVKQMKTNRHIMNKWRRPFYHEFIATKSYSRYITKILNQTHNLNLEIIWTFIPIIIILELIFPSLSLIADDEISSKASLHTVNVIGNQWYWTYEVNVAMGVIKNVSNLLLLNNDADYFENYRTSWKKKKMPARLLATTNSVSIPVGLKTAFFITSNDVAHSWAIPGLGLKVDAIPGRINLKTIIASKIGLYSGMCSEICGIEHGFMPISLKVLTLNKWSYNIEYLSSNGNNVNYSNISNIWYI